MASTSASAKEQQVYVADEEMEMNAQEQGSAGELACIRSSEMIWGVFSRDEARRGCSGLRWLRSWLGTSSSQNSYSAVCTSRYFDLLQLEMISSLRAATGRLLCAGGR